MSLQIVTANRLIDGAVVYFTMDGQWTIWISEACIAETESEAEALLKSAEQSVADNEVVEAYLIEVRTEASTIKPVRYREAIRSKGPTTHPHHGRDVSNVIAGTGGSTTQTFLNGL